MIPLTFLALLCIVVAALIVFVPKSDRPGWRQIVTKRDIEARAKVAPVDPLPPPPAPPPAVLSCFVLGIIRSLETEPDQWERYRYSCLFGRVWRHKAQLVHISEGQRFHCRTRNVPEMPEELPGTIEDYDLTSTECAAVYAALKTHVIDPETCKAQEGFAILRAERAADLAARKVAFEKLGCPPTTP